jgi:hypothetical protein
MASLLKSQNCEANRQLLLWNGSVFKPTVRQRLISRHAKAATDTHVIEELLEAVFSLRYVLKVYNKGQLPEVSYETVKYKHARHGPESDCELYE